MGCDLYTWITPLPSPPGSKLMLSLSIISHATEPSLQTGGWVDACRVFEAAVRRLSPMHEQGEGGSFFHEHVRGQCLCTSRVRVARSSEKNRIQKLDALFSPCQRSESKGLSAVGRLKLASLYLEFLWARGAAEGTSCLRPSPIGLRPLHLDYSSTLSPPSLEKERRALSHSPPPRCP